ncbi:MAG: hypothetical protein ACPHRO_11390 [Nannocystaceae bacterium]
MPLSYPLLAAPFLLLLHLAFGTQSDSSARAPRSFTDLPHGPATSSGVGDLGPTALLQAAGCPSPSPEDGSPRRWDQFEVETTVERDLDGDGALDLAVILVEREDHDSTNDRSRDRILVLGRRDATSFQDVQQSSCLSLATGEGGMMGDPGGHLEPRGADGLIVGNDGGSAIRWSLAYTIAWRKDAFRVTGIDIHTFSIHEPNQEDSVSMNLLTGRFLRNGRGPLRPHPHTAPRMDECGALEDIQAEIKI